MRYNAVNAIFALLAIIVPSKMIGSPAYAQAPVQYLQPGPMPPLVPVDPSMSAGTYGAPAPAPVPPSGAYLGGSIQPFDPYALPGNMPSTSPYGTFPPPFSSGSPTVSTPPPSVWTGQPPPTYPGATTFQPGAPYGTPTAPPPVVPGQPSPYATAPTWPDGNPGLYANTNPTAAAPPPYQRLFQDTGLRSTYIYGKQKNDLALTEAGASTTMYFANFLGIQNGLRVRPGFEFHWTSGPSAPATSDVPARLYSGYLDFALTPQITPQFSTELTARFGIFSDFQNFNEDSLRLQASALGIVQTSQTCAMKFGVAYINRVDLKLLPAFGVLWTPNPQTRWDLFFPAPKLANYWTTTGNKQVWWYLAAEYGGGSWSIEREEEPEIGTDERIDINDLRVMVGVECWSLNRMYSFFEAGYVFSREVVYYRVPSDTLGINDSFMLRGGVSW